ncbi:dynein regulatory complex subunit 2 [Scomber scombrus]|uniref:Dynein regulatory complex subunit 2 n=1 Tax=Scomber scombrus TaxID=13677 RepID=A0AAV1Q9B6_SCOSC|nr:dynein regulatory complex subunit 2 [Scomber scombrus]
MPKKAKKGGGGKGGGKTEEERLLYMQQRAQAEEEMAKKKEEILTLFLKDKLQKEERNTAVNLLKLNEGWRAILRQTRAVELRKDVTVFSQTFERQLDGLHSIIKTLERDLQEAERQSARVRRVHLQQVERLRAQQDQQMLFLQQQWEQRLHHLCSTHSSERKHVTSHAGQQRAELEDAAFSLDKKHEAALEEIHRLYSESMAACDNAFDEMTTSLLMETKDKLLMKSRQHQEVLQSYTADANKLQKLVSKNQHLIERLNTDMKNLKRLQDAIFTMRANLVSSKTENEGVTCDLTAGKDEVNRRTHRLRSQLTQAHAAARQQLADLTVTTAATTKKLQAVIAKGERVLRVGEMCEKLESEQENVFTTLSSTTDELKPEMEGAAKDASTFPELQQVMRRCNASLLQREALRKHREDLNRENQQLRLLLRQHLDAMTVSDATLDGRHALLTVHAAPVTVNAAAATGRGNNDRRHVAFVEAVHAFKH